MALLKGWFHKIRLSRCSFGLFEPGIVNSSSDQYLCTRLENVAKELDPLLDMHMLYDISYMHQIKWHHLHGHGAFFLQLWESAADCIPKVKLFVFVVSEALLVCFHSRTCNVQAYKIRQRILLERVNNPVNIATGNSTHYSSIIPCNSILENF